MSAKEILKGKLLGFSLLELMVVVAILGVLATVAVPRFNIFRARSRQAEAKSSLGVIFTLQESFAIDHERYYDGDETKWGGVAMNKNGTRYGYGGSGNSGCVAGRSKNKLGFRLANCEKARYGYFINGAGEDGFLAIAYGASDTPGDKRIFPGCEGTDASHKPEPTTRPASAVSSLVACSAANADGYAANKIESQFESGDAWCTDEARNVYNYRDIVEDCE